jgi:hypothetical protein
MTRDGPPAWGVARGLTTPQRKKKRQHVAKCYTGPKTSMDSLEQTKQRKMDIRLELGKSGVSVGLVLLKQCQEN